ncbi:MAG: hypothetical protein GY822_03385 [Deltaproteobacteria bacterium]|nr:hypothetical protein [Deltaproteobacteria bacterium]
MIGPIEQLFLDDQTGLPGPEALYSSLHRVNSRFTLVAIELLPPFGKPLSALEVEWTAHLLRHVARCHEGIYRLDGSRFILTIDGSVKQAGLRFRESLEQERAALFARTGIHLWLVVDDRTHLPGFEHPTEVLHQALHQLRQRVQLSRMSATRQLDETYKEWNEDLQLTG